MLLTLFVLLTTFGSEAQKMEKVIVLMTHFDVDRHISIQHVSINNENTHLQEAHRI